jgi:hypothetical protein
MNDRSLLDHTGLKGLESKSLSICEGWNDVLGVSGLADGEGWVEQEIQ